MNGVYKMCIHRSFQSSKRILSHEILKENTDIIRGTVSTKCVYTVPSNPQEESYPMKF